MQNTGAQSELINTVTVIKNEPLGPLEARGRFYALHLSLPPVAAWQAESWQAELGSAKQVGYSPGQFVMLRPASWGQDLIWPRPLSIGAVTDEVVLFFQVVGRGTSRLAALAAGDRVQMVGPLGTGFEISPAKPTLLLAGGMGIAPFAGYVQDHPAKDNLQLLFGHRPDIGHYPFALLAQKISAGHYQEKTPEDLRNFLSLVDESIAAYAAKNGGHLVLACGPLPFLQAVQAMSLRHKAHTQLSLEARMACGVGACLGCVIKPLLDSATGKNKSAHIVPEQMHKALPVPSCTCGPVFWADSIDLA